MRKHITSMLYIMAAAFFFCAPMAGAGDDPKSPHAPGAAVTPVDRKCEMDLAQGQMWVNLIYLKAGKEYKFGATGDTNVKTIGLYIKRPHHEGMEKHHREGMLENENNMLGTKMMENHESMGDKEAMILMQSIGDAPTLCFTPDVDGHYKFKAVLQALSPDAQYGKVTITIKEGCSPTL